jgi:hypothetical protein
MLASFSTFEDYIFLHNSDREFRQKQLDKWIAMAKDVYGDNNRELPMGLQNAIECFRKRWS